MWAFLFLLSYTQEDAVLFHAATRKKYRGVSCTIRVGQTIPQEGATRNEHFFLGKQRKRPGAGCQAGASRQQRAGHIERTQHHRLRPHPYFCRVSLVPAVVLEIAAHVRGSVWLYRA